MKPPIHCNAPAKPYAKLYKQGKITHSIEMGFCCPVCKQVRIPSEKPFDRSDMDKMEAIRLEGIKFDESLAAGKI